MRSNLLTKKGIWRVVHEIQGQCVHVHQDDLTGVFYVGTVNGLIRMDGKDLFFIGANDPSISNRRVDEVCNDSEGNVWFHSHGLYCWNKNDRRVKQISPHVICLCADKKGRIWFAENNKVKCLDRGRMSEFPVRTIDSWRSSLYEDDGGGVWYADLDSIYRFDGRQFVAIPVPKELKHFISSITIDQKGILWIGTWGKGIYQYENGRFRVFSEDQRLLYVRRLYIDKYSNIWFGTWGNGAVCYDGSTMVSYTAADGLSGNDIAWIMQDREGNYWFACGEGGLCHYDAHSITYVAEKEGVQEIIIRADGHLLWGSGNKLQYYNGVQVDCVSSFSTPIYGLLMDRKKGVWVYAFMSDLLYYENLYQKRPPKVLDFPVSMKNVWLSNIIEDKNGDIFCCRSNGLWRFDGKNAFVLEHKDLTGDIGCAYRDTAGRLWFTERQYPRRIGHIENGGIRWYTEKDGWKGYNVTGVMQDRNGKFWFSSYNGLCSYDGYSFRYFHVEDGLSAVNVRHVMEDKRGCLWLATLGGGVSRYDGTDFQKLKQEDGLPCNYVRGVFEDTDGSVIIGTFRGIVRYMPDYKTRPFIFIREVNDVPIGDKQESMTISGSLPSIHIVFRGNSVNTCNMRYRYRLDGYDTEWKTTWSENVRYEKLSAGEYTFSVFAINRDLVRSKNPAKLRISVTADTRDAKISELEQKVREHTRELREEKQFIDNVVQFMSEALIVIAPDRTIIKVNQAAIDLLGVGEFEMIGRPLGQAFSEAEKLIFNEYGLDHLEKNGPIRNKEICIDKNGKEIPLLFSVSVMREDDARKIYGVVCIALDITERKKEEDERRRLDSHLQQIQKTESLGLLAGGIAHDFNNLLMIIMGSAESALKQKSTEKIYKSIEDIMAAGKRASNLSAQMLAYSGRSRFVLEPVDLNELVRDVYPLLESSVMEKAGFQCHFADSLPMIEGEKSQLEQIITNLVINAAEAIGEHEGLVTVTTGEMDCDGSKFPEKRHGTVHCVYLEVRDTGCGMDEETQKKILDPFFSTKQQGRGLGLSVVSGIVRSHKGKIRISSEKGAGSAFRIIFPASTKAPVLKPVETPRSPTELVSIKELTTLGKVLIVDDEQGVLSVTKNLVEWFGFSTLTASNGKEGLDVFRKNTKDIALVLLDMTMPELNGPEVFRKIREVSNVPVILCSGYSVDHAVSHFDRIRPDGFLQKPYCIDDLSALIQKAMHKKV